jgi:hypothetical protein
MPLKWLQLRPFAGLNNQNAADMEARAVPLQDLPRLSTETQRRNGFVQSHAADRTTRIAEDMKSGV